MLMENDSISVNTLIQGALPGYEHHFEGVPQKDQIRLRDLMSNSSGLWWDEWSSPYTDATNDAVSMKNQMDWTDWVLSKPMIQEPGTTFNYNSGNAILTGKVIEYFSGSSIEDYAAARLFAPLGIDQWQWDKMGDGSEDVAWGLKLKPLDLAKIGYLFIDKGRWLDNQIFDETWGHQSTRARKSISGYYRYGYQWWRFADGAQIIGRLRANGLENNDVFFSWGRGGQLLLVIPSFEMVVVMTGGNGLEYDISNMELLVEYIIPSMRFTSNFWSQ
jgi:CubicO group peptidase (beta-lactamase class C family)